WSAFSLIDWADCRLPRMPVTTTSSTSVVSGSCEAGADWAWAAAGCNSSPSTISDDPARQSLPRRVASRYILVAFMPSSPGDHVVIGQLDSAVIMATLT